MAVTSDTSTAPRGTVRRFGLSEALESYREQWYSLLRAPEYELFLAPEWVYSTAAANGVAGDVEVLVEEDGAGRPIWLCPLLKQRQRMFGIECQAWEAPGNALVAYHGGVLSRGTQGEALEALADALLRDADVLVLPAVVEGGSLDAAIGQFRKSRRWMSISQPSYASPYVPIRSSWQEFLQTKSSNFRYSLGRKDRALKKKGNIEERWFTIEADVAALLEAMLAIEGESWKVSAEMAISTDSIERKYYERLLPFLASSGALAANAIYLDGEPIAYSLCYKWGGKLGQLKTSFSERYSGLSPGLVINERAVRRAFEEGCTEFDFLGDVMPHKMHWTKDVRAHHHYYFFAPTLKMRLLGGAKLLTRALRGQERAETAGRGAHRRNSAEAGEEE